MNIGALIDEYLDLEITELRGILDDMGIDAFIGQKLALARSMARLELLWELEEAFKADTSTADMEDAS